MKTFLYVSVILIVIVIITQAFVMSSTNRTEQHKYVVLKSFDGFEVRRYAPALFSSVKMPASTYEQTANSGFRVLAGYIFGGNASNQQIAMTSPVSMEIGDTTKMSFMVPSAMDANNLPKPNDKNIFFEEQGEKIMAAIEFGGWASDERIREYEQKLRALLQQQGLQHAETFSYLGYNPPYTLINRRNEIVVEVLNFQ